MSSSLVPPGLAVLFLLSPCAACRTAGPEATLGAYREALERRDAAAVLRLSDARFREAYTEAEVLEALEEPGRAPELEAQLGRAGSARELAEVPLEGGATVLLVREGGGWRVARGALEPVRLDSPERALDAFFRAFSAGRLASVRAAIPRRFRDAFADDAALSAHLSTMRSRILSARAALGPLTTGRAVVHGDSAELTYGPGLRVTFEREDGDWRIVDVE